MSDDNDFVLVSGEINVLEIMPKAQETPKNIVPYIPPIPQHSHIVGENELEAFLEQNPDYYTNFIGY